ncbi:MAG: serine/threonine-protein phosphatase [Sedimentisphaerales bacterium]|nr:serine/threonine-protein phosphatase [Sedimentisphaerales bacterium]
MEDHIEQILESGDLQLAVAVQRALLPASLPKCDCGKIAIRNRMCNGVGGDFCFFEQLGQDQIAFAIGDAVGHGITAALVMSVIIGLLRSAEQDKRRPARMVASVNDLLLSLSKQVNFPITCSMFYGVVDLPSGILLFVNAGHPLALISNPAWERCGVLPTTTVLLGVEGGMREESCHQFKGFDRLLLYTDGLSDARGTGDKLFGQRRLEELLARHRQMDVEVLMDAIFNEIDAFRVGEPEDDMTLVAVDFKPTVGLGD